MKLKYLIFLPQELEDIQATAFLPLLMTSSFSGLFVKRLRKMTLIKMLYKRLGQDVYMLAP